jgi:lipopolysaccharide transport system permease protein
MTLDSTNSTDIETPAPIPIERRVPDAAAPAVEDDSTIEYPPIEETNTVTVYSAESEIRHPVRLVREIFSDFWLGRELSWRLFLRNIRGLYRQTLLGLFWAFLPPIANTAVWIFLKEAGVFDTGDIKVNATVYILTGMILWQAFIDAFQMPLDVLTKNKNMIAKLNFPRESLLLVGVGEIIFNLLIRMLLLIPAFFIFGVDLHLTILIAPFFILALIILGASLGLLIMPFGSLYQDVGRFIGLTSMFWMIITPVMYPPLVDYPGSLLNWVNLASPLIIFSRDMLLMGTSDHLMMGLIFCGMALPLALVGLVIYRISIPVLVERMTA